MTERVRSFHVILDRPIREDDAQAIIAAISQFRGVISVVPDRHDWEQESAIETAKYDLRRQLLHVLMPAKERS